MEKLTVDRFREIKSDIIEMIELKRQDNDNSYEFDFDKKRERLIELKHKIKLARDELRNHDLSGIDFEEYMGFIDVGFDFDGTGANLDFNIINFSQRPFYIGTPIRVKGCNIKNVNLDSLYEGIYDEESFDEEFKQANPRYFLKKEVTDKDVRKRFYNRELTLQDIENWDLYDDCYIERLTTNWFGDYDSEVNLRKIAEIIGLKNLVYLGTNFVNIFIDDSVYSKLEASNLSSMSSQEDVENIVFGAIQNDIGLDTNKLISLDNKDTRKKLIESLKKVHYSEELKRMMKYAEISLDSFIDNLKEYKEYMEKMADIVEQVNITESVYYDLYNGILNILSKTIGNINCMKYFEEHIELLQKAMFNNMDISDYMSQIDPDFFEKKHPDWILDEKTPKSLRRIFYKGNIKSFQLIKEHPECQEFLEGKNLRIAFSKEYSELFDAYDTSTILSLAKRYGKFLDKVKPNALDKKPTSQEDIEESIQISIEKNILDRISPYDETVPDFFKEKYPELFLDEKAPQELKKFFYDGNTISFQLIKEHPEWQEFLEEKNLSRAFSKEYSELFDLHDTSTILSLAKRYGKFLDKVKPNVLDKKTTSQEDIEELIQRSIEKNILDRISPYDETIPDFFKEKYPELFLDEKAPQELKKFFYDGETISFQLIKEHPEWKEFLQGKDLSRAFPKEYTELFKRFDRDIVMKLGTRNPETIEKMVQNHKENVLENWYKSTGGKFVPHYVVMLNFPEGEIDSFLSNSKRWSQLMRIDNYNLNDDGKAAILKASYAMGVFQGDDDGFNKTMKLFTDVPQELSQEEYEKVVSMFNEKFDKSRLNGSNFESKQKYEEMEKLFEQTYTLNDDGKYVFRIEKQKNKDKVRMVRKILEKAQIPRILTPEKAHQIFDSFIMEYNPDFVRFFNDNVEEILSNPEYTKNIATIQRQFKDIVKINAGRRLTLDVAQDYIKNIVYTDIEVGNEEVAEQAKIAGYSQEDFETIQRLFDEGEVREFSSIPRIQGRINGYTYEMLRCDDPLALTIGTLTDCCQEIHGAGQTSMEHSVVSPDGRVFCVRDAEGRLVAQSWFWRNQYTGCFDNIEIPNKIFELYEKEHPKVGRKGLTKDVLEVYKKAAQDLMQEDTRVYQELLENGTITQEQYDALLLGKVTIGLGYNDIADAIRTDKTIHKENDKVGVKATDRLPNPYTDANTQYTIAERDKIVKSKLENLYVHQDDVPVFDGTNMSSTVLLTMKRMEQTTEKDNLAYLSEMEEERNLPKSQMIINSIAREYGLDPDSTKVMATARIALIYSKDKDNKVKIGELLSSPLQEGLTEEQKQKATAHIMYQIKKALKQIGVQDSKVDISLLSQEQQQMLQSIMQEIKKENDKRGEK